MSGNKKVLGVRMGDDEFEFIDDVAEQLAHPGQTISRSDAVRILLASARSRWNEDGVNSLETSSARAGDEPKKK